MSEPKSKKNLDATGGKPHWKPQMDMEEYREWGLHELDKNSIICFRHFKDTFVELIPSWVIKKAPKWIEQQKEKVKMDFLLAIMFDELNQNFLSKKSTELSVKYNVSQPRMYFEVLKGFIKASELLYIQSEKESRLNVSEDNEGSFLFISFEELIKAKTRFRQRVNPIYRKCLEIGIDLKQYDRLLDISGVPKDLSNEQFVSELNDLTVKLKNYPNLKDEIIDSIPTAWLLFLMDDYIKDKNSRKK